MFPHSHRLLVFFIVGLVGTGWARGDQEADVRLWDKMWANLPPGATTVLLGDQVVPIEVARAWRNRVAGIVPEGPTELSSQTGVNLWPGGNVYFDYDANVSAAHRVAFENAIKDWELAANIHFIPRTSQTNFIRVTDAGSLGGGNSAVGMVGGMQILNIGTASWTREVILHEVGHALGIIHEHQRSDRDNYVTIVTANIQAGKEGNFVKIPTSTNITVYDFLSVMHYFRNAFSTSSNLDTIVPLPAYTAYIDQMGIRSNPVISRSDRQAMAALYGPGPALSLIVKNTKDSGLDSLRAALVKASDLAEDTPGLHPVVSFEIPGTDPNFAGGVFTIRLTSPLQPYFNTVVDGTTQTAFTGNTNTAGPEIVITRATPDPSDGNAPGIEFAGAGSEIRGFVINGFEGPGVEIGWPTATLNTVAGCYIGVNAAGTAAVGNDYQGVLIRRQAHHNVIGGTSASARNLISGNGEDGVLLADANTTGNVVQGNWIGLDAAGAAAIPNFYAGVMVRDNAQSNTIGGDVAGAGNVISGNYQDGVMVYGPAPDNRVQGNLIGLNAAGTAAVGNGIGGITVAAAGTLVGGTTAAARNVVSGNDTGIVVYRSITTGSTISGNWIGLNAAGTSAVPNTSSGVSISTQASSNVIGGTSPGARNIISGNVQLGVIIQGTGVNGNVVQGNWIGLNGTGSAAIPNQFGGIQISSGATGNTIGGTVPGSGNIVSGNASSGVSVAAANSNTVTGNWIGLNAAGNGAVPNTGTGVIIFSGANNNIIGGTAPGAGNVIAGNTSYGIRFTGAGTTANTAAGNLIGLDPSGLSASPNSPGGMLIDTSASGNFVGTPSGGRNYISGNTGTGIFLTADGNTVQGNTIGLNLEGAPVPNTTSGVTIQAKNTIVGGVGAGQANLISRNGSRGIIVSNTGNTGNRISGNSIYLNTSAAIDLNGGTTGTNGLTSNDSGDADTGPNNLQNFPVITSAVLGASGTTVSGSLNSIASSTFTIQFFAAPAGGPANVGDLRYYLGQANVNTNGSGNATISTTLPIAVPAGLLVTATATDSSGNTSEAQAGVTVTLTGDSDADGIPDAYESANGLTIGVNDAALDRDGDGMSNLAEFRAGTGANNSASVLRVTNVEAIGADFRLTFPSVAGRNYRIEYADALSASTVWRLMTDQVLSAGGNLQIVDPGAFGRTSRFYRVQLQP